MKKIQSIVAGLLAVALLTCSASAMTFPDVSKDSDYSTAVEYVSDLKIMVGDSQGNFNPNQIVTRAEMATIICRMLNQTENLQNSTVFTDVPLTHWANSYIAKAAQLGIVGGYGNGKFGPSDTVTFEQAVTMVIRAIGENDKATSYGGYPNGFIQVAEERFLLEGIQAKQGQGLSRGAVAMLLYNYYLWMPAKPNDGHTHQYIEKTMPGSGTGGHYEEVQVQIGTKTVEDRKSVTTYHCGVCDLTSTDWNVLLRHVDARYAESKPENGGHCGARTWSETKNVVVGTHEEPNYETRTTWVSDSATTIRICEICGQQEP